MYNQAVVPLAIIWRVMQVSANKSLIDIADFAARMLNSTGPIVRRNLHLLVRIQCPPQPFAQLSCERSLDGVRPVLVQAYGEGYAHRSASKVPTCIAMVGVVQVE